MTPAWPNEQGHFGKISANTHWCYESLVAPRILTTRIRHDLEKTLNPQADATWDVDEDLRPDEGGRGLTTANLLGWTRSTTMTTEQLSAVQGVGITPEEFPVDNNQFQMCRPLFELIADKVRMLTRHLKLGASFHESSDGSVTQTLLQRRDERIATDNTLSMRCRFGVAVNTTRGLPLVHSFVALECERR
ncbi:hypothetical protein L798_10900 [Zootermopsis nevadensis]|uniref:Uncharacterized protein n=1 Tax=Zootermopsis nevadensis TaxID=136037 RepID=A0A067QGU5_ZOONE|nr:hypothetical protein L798_10900 [Zootermopsis nevadensis]